MNVSISPVLAALTLTAAILFTIVCIVSATLYRKHTRRTSQKLKSSSKHNHVSATPLDCQLDPATAGDQTRNSTGSRAVTPIVDGTNIVRGVNGVDIAVPDIDDADPDIIPNQYGKYQRARKRQHSFHFSLQSII